MIYIKLRYNQVILIVIACTLVLPFTSHAYGATATGKPTNLSATAVSSSQINLSWTAPVDNGGSAITGYKIEVKKLPDTYPVTPLVANTGSTATSYSHTGVTSGQYVYKISAINSVGTGESSSEAFAEITTSQNIAPNPPTGLTAVAASS